jgi:membrane-bound acyltransferase YfiQ involved in biofilm formation
LNLEVVCVEDTGCDRGFKSKYPKIGYAPPLKEDRPESRHLFVDNVRFWSMVAIVSIHGITMGNIGGVPPSFVEALMTPWKFGTIAFFLTSGFLLGERIEKCSPWSYLGRRLQRVFLPWLVWISVLTSILIASDVIHHRTALDAGMGVAIWKKFYACLTATSFWFVPNLFVGLTILLIFRRHLRNLRLGAALLAIDLVYVANIYARWWQTSHTKAVFGFVFYLWLGSYASLHYKKIALWTSRIRMKILVSLALLAGLAAFAEARWLDHLGSADPCNTLRLTNQFFSIVVVFILLKLRRATWPGFVNVRNHTFGIYLSHTIILILLCDVFSIISQRFYGTSADVLTTSLAVGIAGKIVFTAVTYILSLAVAKAFSANGSLQWVVGSPSSEKPAKKNVPLTRRIRENDLGRIIEGGLG